MSNGGGRSHTAIRQERDETMPDGDDMPFEVNFSTPNVARMYDYYLGGKDNYAADREAARRVLRVAPDVPLAALENREFLKRVMRLLMLEQGIGQFIDIGPGLPTQGNVHQLARQHDPDARVVYVDNDAVVLAHSGSLLDGVAGVTIIDGDLRDPERIFSHSGLLALIDPCQPAALFMTLVLHFIPASSNPHAIVAKFRDALPPGSFLILSHVTGDGRAADTLTAIDETYDSANAPLVMRPHAEIMRFFDGFDLVDPGVVFLSQWRPTGEYYAQGGTRWAYAGVGKKA
jgi:S-adenosyl methyltransferase